MRSQLKDLDKWPASWTMSTSFLTTSSVQRLVVRQVWVWILQNVCIKSLSTRRILNAKLSSKKSKGRPRRSWTKGQGGGRRTWGTDETAWYESLGSDRVRQWVSDLFQYHERGALASTQWICSMWMNSKDSLMEDTKRTKSLKFE